MMLYLIQLALVILHDPVLPVQHQLWREHELVQGVVGVVEEEEEEALGREAEGAGHVEDAEVRAAPADAREQVEGDVAAVARGEAVVGPAEATERKD